MAMAPLMSDSGAGMDMERPVVVAERLQAQQFEDRADKDIHACAENVGSQETVAVRAVGLGQMIEHAHQRFQQRLQLPGISLKWGMTKMRITAANSSRIPVTV